MANARNRATISFSTTLTISEVEIRALDALVGYGDDAFLKHFKESLGAAYIGDHEVGLRSFFATVRRDVLPALHDIDQARNDIDSALAGRRQASRQAWALEDHQP